MAGYLLADSFGGLQSAENAQDSNRRQALASAMQNAMSGLQFMTKDQGETRREDQAQENWQKQFGLQKSAQDIARQKAADEEWRQIQANDVSKGYLKLMQDQGTQAGVRSHLDEVRLAQQDAAAGIPAAPAGMAPEDYFTTFHPGLKPGEVKALAGSAIDAQQQKETEFTHAQKVADTLNNFDTLAQHKAASDKELANFSVGKWVGTQAYKDAKARNDELTAAHAKLAPIVNQLKNPKTNPYFGTRVIPTPDGGYENITPVPRHLLQPAPDSQNPFVPTTGGDWMRPNAQGPIAPTSTGTTGRKYSPLVYQRVNELLGSVPGMDPVTATRQALGEYQQAADAGNLP